MFSGNPISYPIFFSFYEVGHQNTPVPAHLSNFRTRCGPTSQNYCPPLSKPPTKHVLCLFFLRTPGKTANLCAFLLLPVHWVTIIFTESQGAPQLPIQISYSHSEQANANSGESGDTDGATKAGDCHLKRKPIADTNDVRGLFFYVHDSQTPVWKVSVHV